MESRRTVRVFTQIGGISEIDLPSPRLRGETDVPTDPQDASISLAVDVPTYIPK
jgi:hypothetical protein